MSADVASPTADTSAMPVGEIAATQCLRCGLTLSAPERERGGRWKEFCEP